MSNWDLREHLDQLAKYGLLNTVNQPVDKNWELSSVMRWVYMGFTEENRYAVLFNQVQGYQMRVVCGAIGGSYKTYAVGLGIDPHQPRHQVMRQIRAKWINALRHPIEPILIDSAPLQQQILTGDQVNTHLIPAPVWTPEKDRGWEEGLGFLTSPYHITKDPETGIRNVGTYRTMLKAEKNLLGIAGHSAHIRQHINKNEAQGKVTEIATVIGADPVIGMVSVAQVPYGVDELTIAGGLRGEPIQLVKCATVDLEVPATAEIVIEGRILPRSMRPYEAEAPFGEYTGYQGSARYGPVYEVTAICFRNDAIYQAYVSQMPPSESSKVRQLCHEAMIMRHLQDLGMEEVVDVHIPETTQMGMIIVSIRKSNEGQPMRIAHAILSLLQPRWGKFIVVTDDDVDIYDPDNVNWAVTFRTSLAPDRRRVYFLEGLLAQTLDYSSGPSLDAYKTRWDWPSQAVLIDATRPYAPYPVVSLPPKKYLEQALNQWEAYGLPPLQKRELPRAIEMEEEYLQKGLAAAPEFIPIKKME